MSSARDKIRSAILGIKAVSKIVVVGGVEVEMRQPPVGEILSETSDGNRQQVSVNMLVNYTFVPGTDEAVFTREDAEVLMQIPFGKDWMTIQTAVNDLTNMGESYVAELGNSSATGEVKPSSDSPSP